MKINCDMYKPVVDLTNSSNVTILNNYVGLVINDKIVYKLDEDKNSKKFYEDNFGQRGKVGIYENGEKYQILVYTGHCYYDTKNIKSDIRLVKEGSSLEELKQYISKN